MWCNVGLDSALSSICFLLLVQYSAWCNVVHESWMRHTVISDPNLVIQRPVSLSNGGKLLASTGAGELLFCDRQQLETKKLGDLYVDTCICIENLKASPICLRIFKFLRTMNHYDIKFVVQLKQQTFLCKVGFLNSPSVVELHSWLWLTCELELMTSWCKKQDALHIQQWRNAFSLESG